MKGKILLSLLICLTMASISMAQYVVPTLPGASVDTVFIPGGTLSNAENGGSMEATINGDTTLGVGRTNVNRVYALYEGEVYYQLAGLYVFDPAGTLNIVGVADRDPNYTATTGLVQGYTKPLIVIQPTNGVPVVINNGGVGEVYGSINLQNIHIQTQQTDGTQQNEMWYCGTANQLPQSLTVNNCLFEFSNIDLFDCTNETGAIGGWPYGAKIRITNSYFRNMFFIGQWWGSRVFQCKHPIDTLWVENCTVTTAGLTFLQQNELVAFAYFNHNTIINNKKYWILSPFYVNLIVANNIFTNQDWVGEDTTVRNSGQDPDKLGESTINIDTTDWYHKVAVQPIYQVGNDSTFSPELSLQNMNVYVTNNINYNDPLLATDYYNNSAFTLPTASYSGTSYTGPAAPPSYLTWYWSNTPFAVTEMPGLWMNSRTAQLFNTYKGKPLGAGGGMVEENTITTQPITTTSIALTDKVANAMGVWNQNQYGDPRYTAQGPIDSTAYIYGDYSPTTVPGKINGVSSDAVTGEGTGIQVGITKFTDLTENFYQSAAVSTVDHQPIGSLIWNDAALAAYSSTASWTAIETQFTALTGRHFSITAVKESGKIPYTFSLSQNYPNPFNPSTVINYSLQNASNVTLSVYNILGQKIATLVNGYKPAGSYTAQFDATKYASGVYIYRIEAGNFIAFKKMMLLK